MVLLHQRLVFRLDGLERRIGAEPHHLQRLALGVEHLSGLDLGLRIRAGPPAAATVELAEHGERIGGAVQIRFAVSLLGLMRMESKNFDESIGMADYDNAMRKASSLDIANTSLSMH